MKIITQESSNRKINTTELKYNLRDDGEIEPLATRQLNDLEDFFSAISTSYIAQKNFKSGNEDFVVISEPEMSKRAPSKAAIGKNDVVKSTSTTHNDGAAQKKFGAAKAISSDQYFRDSANDDSVSSRKKFY